jgi:hypothetical protein
MLEQLRKLEKSSKELKALHKRLLDRRPPQELLHADNSRTPAVPEKASEIGHVFVVRGDLRNLHCDASLGYAREQPNELTYANFSEWLATKGWQDAGLAGDQLREKYQKLYTEALKGKRITACSNLPNLTPQQSSGTVLATSPALKWPNDLPLFFSFTVTQREVMQLCKGARCALKAIHRYCKSTRGTPMLGAHKFTYLMTVVGGSTPEFQENMGEVLLTLLESLNKSATELGCDIGLVCWEKSHYFMLQSLRVNGLMAERCFASILDDLQLRAEAARLAELASTGQLVIFLGAGVSMGAGLPSWGQLLKDLASNASPPIDIQSEEWKAMDMLTQADILERRTDTSLGEQIAAVFSRFKHYSLVHAILANTPCTEYVTTNYDTMMETALTSFEDAPKVSVLPHQMLRAAKTWVLKMHGCVTDPEHIVLTRKDYIRYADRAAALSGIVQAKLMTKHMLFVGFSLTDDNFYRIADTVKKSLPTGAKFGTAMQLMPALLKEELWSEELSFVNCGAVGEPFAAAVRRHSILLDYISALANSHACPILDPRFHNVISAGQKKLGARLQAFLDGLDNEAMATKEYSKFADIICDLQTDLQTRAHPDVGPSGRDTK